MKYKSTRGGVSGLSFEQAVMMGLAEDGGLLVPENLPYVGEQLSQWLELSFHQLCFEIMTLFVGEDLTRSELESLIENSFLDFRHPLITPVHSLQSVSILELFHGPTYAFKDIALQFLGNLFEFIITKNDSSLNVLGATSGDTGSAAIYGLRGKSGIQVFMLHPLGRVSPIQEKQMTTVMDENVHNLGVKGTFDDAQSIVKSIFNDVDFKKTFNLGAINSINWARIMAQIVYYFHAWVQISSNHSENINFVVPTGNFGNVLAAHYARRMGLPISDLVVATNSNDILHRFFTSGSYQSSTLKETLSPSMDIQISSNFERYLFELSGFSSTRLNNWMEVFSKEGRLELDQELQDCASLDFHSVSVDNEETLEIIRSIHLEEGYLVDPHTAVGICAALKCRLDQPVVCLACAHPAKFDETIFKAIGSVQDLPPELRDLKNKDTRCVEIEAESDFVRQFIETKIIR